VGARDGLRSGDTHNKERIQTLEFPETQDCSRRILTEYQFLLEEVCLETSLPDVEFAVDETPTLGHRKAATLVVVSRYRPDFTLSMKPSFQAGS
jgi:hypothetical protein